MSKTSKLSVWSPLEMSYVQTFWSEVYVLFLNSNRNSASTHNATVQFMPLPSSAQVWIGKSWQQHQTEHMITLCEKNLLKTLTNRPSSSAGKNCTFSIMIQSLVCLPLATSRHNGFITVNNQSVILGARTITKNVKIINNVISMSSLPTNLRTKLSKRGHLLLGQNSTDINTKQSWTISQYEPYEP